MSVVGSDFIPVTTLARLGLCVLQTLMTQQDPHLEQVLEGTVPLRALIYS